MHSLTIVVPFRNRSADRVERFLESLAAQTSLDFHLIFIDYGSELSLAQVIRGITSNFSFCTYVYSDTRGYIWNKSKAINIGIRRAKSTYILTTDIDIIFSPNFVEVVLHHARPNRVLCCYPLHLPERFSDWENVGRFQVNRFGNKRMLGACQCVSTGLAQEIRGFDEYYYFWGKEDLDYKLRLDHLGVEEFWLNDITIIYHQWHPRRTAYTDDGYLPDGMWGRLENYNHRNRRKMKRNDDSWGRIVATSERSIFNFLDLENIDLLHKDAVHYMNTFPTTNRALSALVRSFWNLPSGHVLAIEHANYPKRTLGTNAAIRLLNKITRNHLFELDYRPNLVRNYLPEFLTENLDVINDYFLDFPLSDGLNLILKK